ncbi:16155_t:CDS:1, partial [Cetraspora pellucida]
MKKVVCIGMCLYVKARSSVGQPDVWVCTFVPHVGTLYWSELDSLPRNFEL